MSSKDTSGFKRSAEEASFHDNESYGKDFQQQQPFWDRVTLPMNLIIGSILPFVQDRLTWNKLCVANKELRDASRIITPPWPESTLQQVCFPRAVVFSPCGHYLACSTGLHGAEIPSHVYIFDRRNGQRKSLTGGHGHNIVCLSFSDDGKYLAAGGNDGSIRIWRTDSTGKPTQQGLKTLPFQQTEEVQCVAFASDSNILASGSENEINLWNVEDDVCIQTFDHHHGRTSSLVFSGVGESIQCLAATTDGSLIRISLNSSHSAFTSDQIIDGATGFRSSVFSHCGSFLATVDFMSKLCLYEIKTDSAPMIQSIPAFCIRETNAGMAFSPDNKMLAVISDTRGEDETVGQLLDVKDLTLQRQFMWQLRDTNTISLVVDPSSRYLPVALAIDPSSRYLAVASYAGSAVHDYGLYKYGSSFASSPATTSAAHPNGAGSTTHEDRHQKQHQLVHR